MDEFPGYVGGPLGYGATGQTSPAMKGIGPGGIPIRKKVKPKSKIGKLKENTNWKKSFAKFSTKGKKIT